MKQPTPKHTIGDPLGSLRVSAYCGYSFVHPETEHDYTRRHHFYETRCRCGTVEVMTQQALETRTCCLACIGRVRVLRNTKSRNVANDTTIPDFARLPLVSAEMRERIEGMR